MLNWYQKERVDIYIKHYSMLTLEITHEVSYWEVSYTIYSMGKDRPLYMMLARCRSKQLAVVKLSEIEDYVAEYKLDQADEIRQRRRKQDDLYWYMIKSIQNALDGCQTEIEFRQFFEKFSKNLQSERGVEIQEMRLL